MSNLPHMKLSTKISALFTHTKTHGTNTQVCFKQFIKDNHGNTVWLDLVNLQQIYYKKTDVYLKVGELVSFEIMQYSPDYEYSLCVDNKPVITWCKANLLQFSVSEKIVSKFCVVAVKVRKVRGFSPITDYDSQVLFSYHVIP